MSEDGRNFDDLFDRLSDRVHGNLKGQLRLHSSVRQLKAAVPHLANQPLRVLDVGAGLGQVALLLAADGHDVTALDLSERMVSHIATEAASQNLKIRCVSGSLQSTYRQFSERGETFDLVCCHAALEWMNEPQTAVGMLKQLVKPSGYLSLLCYNNAALVHRNLLRGNFRRAQSADTAGTAGGLTPTHPIELEALEGWLAAAGLAVDARFGVRAILDFLPRELVTSRGFESLDEIEQWLEQREPHWRFARYLHLIAHA